MFPGHKHYVRALQLNNIEQFFVSRAIEMLKFEHMCAIAGQNALRDFQSSMQMNVKQCSKKILFNIKENKAERNR